MTEFTLSPAFDGVTTTFTVSAAFQLGTGHVYVNGARKARDDSQWALTENSTTSITLATAPTSNDVIIFEAESLTGINGSTYVAPGARHVQEEVQYNTASQKLTINAEIDGALVTPTSYSAAVYVNGGNTSLITPTVTLSSGVLTATFDTTDTTKFVVNQLYRCIFTFATSTRSNILREVYFVVARVPTQDACPIRIDDLYGLHQRFHGALTQISQTTDAAGRYIVPAWEEVRETLEASGIRASTVNPVSLKTATKYLAACNLCLGLQQSPNDIYASALVEFKARFEKAMQNMMLLARPADNLAGEREVGKQQPVFGSGPHRDMENAPGIPLLQALRSGPFGGLR